MSPEQLRLEKAAANDPLARSVYADWLEENDRPLAAAIYRGQETSLTALHHAVTDARRGTLVALIQAAKASRNQSVLYWARDELRLLSKVGYVQVRYNADLRTTPDPGVVFVRRSRSGKWSTKRAEKFGRPLTWSELLERLETQVGRTAIHT